MFNDISCVLIVYKQRSQLQSIPSLLSRHGTIPILILRKIFVRMMIWLKSKLCPMNLIYYFGLHLKRSFELLCIFAEFIKLGKIAIHIEIKDAYHLECIFLKSPEQAAKCYKCYIYIISLCYIILPMAALSLSQLQAYITNNLKKC